MPKEHWFGPGTLATRIELFGPDIKLHHIPVWMTLNQRLHTVCSTCIAINACMRTNIDICVHVQIWYMYAYIWIARVWAVSGTQAKHAEEVWIQAAFRSFGVRFGSQNAYRWSHGDKDDYIFFQLVCQFCFDVCHSSLHQHHHHHPPHYFNHYHLCYSYFISVVVFLGEVCLWIEWRFWSWLWF